MPPKIRYRIICRASGAARLPWQASAGSSGSSGSCQWFYYSIREFSPIRRSRISRLTWLPFLPMCAIPQWSKWPKFVSLHYWRTPRGARDVKKSRPPNWSPLWWVGALRFSQNWRNCEKPSKLNKNWQRIPVFWRFFEFYSIWAKS